MESRTKGHFGVGQLIARWLDQFSSMMSVTRSTKGIGIVSTQAFKEAADKTFADLCGTPDKKLRPLKKLYEELTEKQKKQKSRLPI